MTADGNSHLMMERDFAEEDEEVYTEPAEETNDDDDKSNAAISQKGHLQIMTTPVVERHVEAPDEPVQYVDERTKAMGRKAELEELRKKNDVVNKKAAFNNKSSPMSTSTLASFFLQQKQMKDDVREKRLGALNSLSQYKFTDFQGLTPKSKGNATKRFEHIPTAYSTMAGIDDFFRKQRKLDLEWKENKEKAFSRLHSYRQEHIHKRSPNQDGGAKVGPETAMEQDSETCGRNDTAVLNALLMVHCELKQFFEVPSRIDEDDEQVVSRLSFENSKLSDSDEAGCSKNIPGVHDGEEKKEKDVGDNEQFTKEDDELESEKETTLDYVDNISADEDADFVDAAPEEGAPKSDDSFESISDALDALLEDSDEPFELDLEQVDASEAKTKDVAVIKDTVEDKIDNEEQGLCTHAANDGTLLDRIDIGKDSLSDVSENKESRDLSPVLDPFTGSAQDLSNGITNTEKPEGQGPTPKRLDLVDPVDETTLEEERSPLRAETDGQKIDETVIAPKATIADSSISSIGSSSPLPSEASAWKSTRESSLLSDDTFWRNDLPPLPDRRDDYGELATCGVEQYLPHLHGSRGACERCLSLASEHEKAKFEATGRHIRIMIVRGGCRRDCVVFPRSADEPPVRLCRKCYFDTHRVAHQQKS